MAYSMDLSKNKFGARLYIPKRSLSLTLRESLSLKRRYCMS